MSLQPEAVLARNERLSWRVLAGEAVILFPDDGSLHRLNGTGTSVWEQLDGERSLAEVAAVLTEEYDVDLDVCLPEVLALAADLIENRLAAPVGAEAADGSSAAAEGASA